MLEMLSIQNIAVIDSAEIPFRKGLNILSGETGAGKSIVIEAVSLLLGSRANVELIRAGCEEAVVTGLFDMSELPWMQNRLEQFGFKSSARELLVKRTVNRNGRHRIHVNGEVTTLAILQDLCAGLVDLCGQHEHQSLLKPTTQLELLDRFGNLLEDVGLYSKLYLNYRSTCKEKEALAQAESERIRRFDFLKFQIEELRSAELKPGEDDSLHQEKNLLQSGEARKLGLETVNEILMNEQEGALERLRLGVSKLKTLCVTDPNLNPIRESLESALIEAEESTLLISRYLDALDLNPERLQNIQDRLAILASLRRKYGMNATEMLATLETLEKELTRLECAAATLSEISEKCSALFTEIKEKGVLLSKKRKKMMGLLADSVTHELHELNMVDAKFSLDLYLKDDIQEWSTTGGDQLHFLVQTNRGEQARALSKIASGGELSRLMLAIRRVIADRGGIGVYLFDEIDAGIGGQTAFQVGKKLKSVAQYNQVICITHLPQVASFADHHLSVRKKTSGKRTIAEVIELNSKDRQEELARMLGGPELTKKSLANASELLNLAQI